MKNYSLYILLYIIVVVLSACAVTKQPAPIEYHHKDSGFESTRSTNENTITAVSNDQEVISSKPEQSLQSEFTEPEEVIKPNFSNEISSIPEISDISEPSKNNSKIIIPEIKEEPIKQVQISKEYINPVEGKLITGFGEKTARGLNKGINIMAPKGANVVAAASGKVIYSDYDATFGNLVIIKLDDKNVVISYAHLEGLIVNKGAHLNKGDIVGHVGSTGQVKEPQLHFAIREGKNAIDPLKFVDYAK